MKSTTISPRTRLAAVCGVLLFSGGLLAACGDSGHAQKTQGQVESAVGGAIGDDKLKNEGKKDEVVGGVKGAVGDVKDAAKDATK